jgi:hypothetical protein
MKHILTLLVFIIPFACVAGDAPEDPFKNAPFTVRKAMKDYDTELFKAKEEYAKQVQKIQNKAIAALTVEVANAYKKGDTKLGMDLAKHLEKMKAEGVTTDLLGNVIVGDDDKKENIATSKLVIHSAKWGIAPTFIDVTEDIRKQVVNNSISCVVTQSSLGFKQDPASGLAKTLIVDYTYNTYRNTETLVEGRTTYLKIGNITTK